MIDRFIPSQPNYINKVIKVRCFSRAVLVAQLVERSLLIPEVHGSNPVIGKIYIEHLFTVNSIEKTKIKKKRPGMAHLKNKVNQSHFSLNF